MASPYLHRPLRSEAHVRTIDLEKFKLRACASVATGGGVALLERLKESLAEAIDPVTHAEYAAKIGVVERLFDKLEDR